MEIIISLLVGLFSGYLASVFVKGSGYGILGDTIIGLVGGFIGGILFSLLGVNTSVGIIGYIFISFVGAVLLLMIAKLIKSQTK